MGMIGKFAAVTPIQLESLINESSQAVSFLPSKGVENKSTQQLDIDKDWHGLHFLLTGESYPNDSPLANEESRAVFG
jgi:Domain of unknown function (DUF1877)